MIVQALSNAHQEAQNLAVVGAVVGVRPRRVARAPHPRGVDQEARVLDVARAQHDERVGAHVGKAGALHEGEAGAPHAEGVGVLHAGGAGALLVDEGVHAVEVQKVRLLPAK